MYHSFERFLAEYESWFEKKCGFLRPIAKEVEGGVSEAGVFHKIPRLNDSRLAEIFAREVLSFFVGRELLSPKWADRLLS